MKKEIGMALENRLAEIQPALAVIDEIELLLSKLPPADMPVKHQFIRDENGKVVMYVRAILMRAGIILTSQIHLTEHPYVILCGKARIWSPDGGWRTVQGPTAGVTHPGTKRVLEIYEDMIFVTFHATDKDDVEAIGRDILSDRENPLVPKFNMAELAKGEYLS